MFTRDQLLTNVMLYWVTQTITSSVRLYWESKNSAGRSRRVRRRSHRRRALSRRRSLRFPRAWVERRYNVTYWADMPRGGHFAAMEQPELFVDDLRNFFRTVR